MLRTTALSNQPTIEAVNTLYVNVRKLLEQQSSLPTRTSQGSDPIPTTKMHKNQQQPGSSSEDPASQKLRAQARMKTIDLLFSAGLTSGQLPLLERRVIFTDKISNSSFENVERIHQHLRELPSKHTETTNVA